MISVIIATYNGEKYLEAQLNSIAAQTLQDMEIIICDDCSSDNTQRIIKEFAGLHKNVSYHFNTVNAGVNKNFEQGFLRAKGDYIAIADQDDIWLPGKLEKQLSLFTSAAVLLVHSASVRFSGTALPSKKTVSSVIPFEGSDTRKLLLRNSVSGHNIIFRKNLLEHALPLPAGIYYDWWLVQTAACNGEVACTNEVLAYQRAHADNVTVGRAGGKNQTPAEYAERKQALHLFKQLKNLGARDLAFINALEKEYHGLEDAGYAPGLFAFLMKNRNILFFYKKGLLRYFSQRKAARRMSSREPS